MRRRSLRGDLGWHNPCSPVGMSLLRTAAITLLFATACAAQGADSEADSGQPTDSGPSCDPTLTYANFGAVFLAGRCNTCHGWTQSQVQSDGAALSNVVLSGFMPPGGGLTQAQRQQFADWIACGAP